MFGFVKSIVISLFILVTNSVASEPNTFPHGYVLTQTYDIVNPLKGEGAEFNSPASIGGLYGGQLLYPRNSDQKPVSYYVDEFGKVHLGVSVRDLHKNHEKQNAKSNIDMGANALKLDVSKETIRVRMWGITNESKLNRITFEQYLPGLKELFGDLKYPKGYVKASAFMNSESHILLLYIARTKWVNDMEFLGKIYVFMPQEKE